MRSFDIYTSANLHVSGYVVNEDQPVLIAFASGGKTREPAGYSMAVKHGINCISIATKEMDWFMYPDLGNAEDAIRVATDRFPRRVTYGFSMGAYGALLSSAALNADCVLAFSPQCAIGPRIGFPERRWSEERARLGEEHGFSNDNIPARLSRTAEVIIIYDPFDNDARHVQQIEETRPVNRIAFPLAGHDTLPALATSGMSTKLLKSVIAGDHDIGHMQRKIHEVRKARQAEGLFIALSQRRKIIPKDLPRKILNAGYKISSSRIKRVAICANSFGDNQAVAAAYVQLIQDAAFITGPTFYSDTQSFSNAIALSSQRDIIIQTLKSKAAAGPATRRVSLLLAAATIAQENGDLTAARAFVADAAEGVTAWDPHCLLLADAYQRMGEDALAQVYYKRVQARTGPDFSSFEVRARLAERANEWATAARIWEEAKAAGVMPIRVAVRLSRCYARLLDFQGALAVLQPALQIETPSNEVLKMAGNALVKTGDVESARRYYQQAVSAAPEDHGAHRSLSNALMKLAKPDLAEPAARNAARLSPTPANLAHLEQVLAKCNRL